MNEMMIIDLLASLDMVEKALLFEDHSTLTFGKNTLNTFKVFNIDLPLCKKNRACHRVNKSRSELGNAPRIGIGHREVVCQK